MKKYTILAGITKDKSEFYFLEIEPKKENHDYFSMSGFSVKPIKQEDAEQQVKEGLEDGALWREAVRSETTSKGLSDWIDEVLSIDGELAGFDNSLYPEEIEIGEENWLFKSRSCGQHEEEELSHYFIPEPYFKQLLALWKVHHLAKENPPAWDRLLNDLQIEGLFQTKKQQAFIIDAIQRSLIIT